MKDEDVFHLICLQERPWKKDVIFPSYGGYRYSYNITGGHKERKIYTAQIFFLQNVYFLFQAHMTVPFWNG